jgi:predicted enzyme related to lactoylglutathione lyase
VPSEGGDGPVVLLQRVPEEPQAKNRVHLDIYAQDAPGLINRLVEAGGKRIEEPVTDEKTRWQVMADPEGNICCVMWEKTDLQEHFRALAVRR